MLRQVHAKRKSHETVAQAPWPLSVIVVTPMNEAAARKKSYGPQEILTVAMLAIAFVLLEWISSIHEYKGLPFTAWDPGLGILFAAMILRPKIAIPALFFGVIGAEAYLLKGSLNQFQLVGVALIITLVYAAAAYCIRRVKGFNVNLPRLSDIVVLLGGGLAGAAVSATLLFAMLIATGSLVISDISSAAWPHIVGDSIGISIITPLCLRYMDRLTWRLPRLGSNHLFESVSFVVCIVLFGWLVAGSSSRETLQYFYLLFIPVVLASVRHGIAGASVMLVFTQAALVGILDWLQADARNFTNYQTLMLALTATGLLVGAIVTERDSAQQSVRAMEWEAARAGRFNLVSGMAAALSHEISQPLTAARARARTVELLAERGDTDRMQEHLKPLIEQIDRAATILQHMRDFLRRGTPGRTPTEWSSIVNGARTLLVPLAAEKKIDFEISSGVHLPTVDCNRVQIEQVLINLAANAFEAIRSAGQVGGRVVVDADTTEDGEALEVSVRDNGPGIDPGMVESLFTATTTTKPDGLGLGISICVAILESHRGRLWLESSGKGDTDFRFRIPLAVKGETT